jgi:hypothetical protein
MKIRTVTLATTFVLSSSLAFAQTGDTGVRPAPERSGAPIAGPGPGGPAVGTTDPHGRNEPYTSGMSQSGPGTEPGARDKSRPGGEGVNDRPAGQ